MAANIKRTSAVGNMKVINVLISSVVFVGDNLLIDPRARVIAVQREVADFLGNEGDFESETVFSRPFPDIDTETNVQLDIKNDSPWIKVGNVKVMSMSTSAVMQVGSTSVIDAQSRAKLFRQLLAGNVPKYPANPDVISKTYAFAAQAAKKAMEGLNSKE